MSFLLPNMFYTLFLSIIHICTCTYIYIYACLRVCTYVCTYVCMHLRMYVCMYVCMYVWSRAPRPPSPPFQMVWEAAPSPSCSVGSGGVDWESPSLLPSYPLDGVGSGGWESLSLLPLCCVGSGGVDSVLKKVLEGSSMSRWSFQSGISWWS